MSSHDDDKRNPSATPPTPEEHPLPVAQEEEPESLHPSVGESWAPKSRDDHMNGMRNSQPELRLVTKIEAEEAQPKAGFFGSVSDAFDISHQHGVDGALPKPAPVPNLDGTSKKRRQGN